MSDDAKLSRRARGVVSPEEAEGLASPAVDPEDPRYLIVAGTNARALRCVARPEGVWCIQPAIGGGTTCMSHGGATRNQRRAAARRLATKRAEAKLEDWGYEPVDDPFAVMADMTGRSVALVDVLASELASDRPNQATIEALRGAIDQAHRQAKDMASTGIEAARLRLDQQRTAMALELVRRLLARAHIELGTPLPGDDWMETALDATLTELESGGG